MASYEHPSRFRTGLKILGIVLAAMVVGGAAGAVYIQAKLLGTGNPFVAISSLGQTAGAFIDPRQYFPGQNRITLLCLGLDRNILISRDPKLNGMPYTKGARSDVMMIASLDLDSQTVSILSVPRDTKVQLPGKYGFAKINQAHADGGVPYTRETVEQFLGIQLDHHVVIKQEAIQKVVDALGGVKINVEKDMDYDDNWGNLHVHLKAGEQVLSGEQVVGYMRFRKDREGDFGRIRRQQQVIQALADKVKSPGVILKAPALIEAVRNHVFSDLTPQQQLALAHLFHKVKVSNIQTASLPIADDVKIRGVDYLEVDEPRKEAVVDWIVRGNREAMNRLITVEVRNASGDPQLSERVYDCLRHFGFRVWRGRRERGKPLSDTRVVQHGTLKGSARRVLEVLGVAGNIEKSDDGGPDVTLYVGKDLSRSPIVQTAELWPELPEAQPVTLASRSARRPRRASEPVEVDVRSVQPEVDVEPEPEPEVTDDTTEAPVPEDPVDDAPLPPAPQPGSPPTNDRPGIEE